MDSDDAAEFQFGDCCQWCDGAWHVTPQRAQTPGLDDQTELDDPRIRHATAAEIAEHGLAVSFARTAYCVASQYGDDGSGTCVFVVAGGVEVSRLPMRPR